jgi:hypothetical protein
LDLTITTKINVVAGDDRQKGMLVRRCQINNISFPRINSLWLITPLMMFPLLATPLLLQLIPMMLSYEEFDAMVMIKSSMQWPSAISSSAKRIGWSRGGDLLRRLLCLRNIHPELRADAAHGRIKICVSLW